MGSEILASQKQNTGLPFDPRTKLAVLITLVLLVLGGSFQTDMFYIPSVAPLIALLLSKMWKGAAVYFVTYGAAICLQEFWLANIPGIVRYLMMIVVGLLLYFGPSVAMAYYIVTTTTVSEFVAGDGTFANAKTDYNSYGCNVPVLSYCDGGMARHWRRDENERDSSAWRESRFHTGVPACPHANVQR